MKKIIFTLVLLVNCLNFQVFSHSLHYDETNLKVWSLPKQNKELIGSFLFLENDIVHIELENHKIAKIDLNELNKDQQNEVLAIANRIKKLNLKISHNQKSSSAEKSSELVIMLFFTVVISLLYVLFIRIVKNPAGKLVGLFSTTLLLSAFTTKSLSHLKSLTDPTKVDDAFAPFKPHINTFWDDTYFYVESIGIPTTHEMMVGISDHGWQQQVPIPQCYIGKNAWSIPLNPEISKSPIPVNGSHFTRGAIAIAINGIPIFNPYTNTGVDAYLDGQLDNYGGHCGRADDYHYHTAPLDLYKYTDVKMPIAYALDGFAVYGEYEPDGSLMKALDVNNGHYDDLGVYHYHGVKSAPYMIANMVGVVTEDSTHQLIPQAVAKGVRPALTPLKGAKITSCTPNLTQNGYTLVYTINNETDSIVYSWTSTGSYTFNFYKSTGLTTNQYKGQAPCQVTQTASLSKPNAFDFSIITFPNPTKDKVYLSISNEDFKQSINKVTLYNLKGELVFEKDTFISEINLKGMPAGNYILQISNPSQKINRKIIVY